MTKIKKINNAKQIINSKFEQLEIELRELKQKYIKEKNINETNKLHKEIMNIIIEKI